MPHQPLIGHRWQSLSTAFLERISLAMLLDSVDAVLHSQTPVKCVVLTESPELTHLAERMGAHVGVPSDTEFMTLRRRQRDERAEPVNTRLAVIASNLPCLGGQDVHRFLGQAQGQAASYVADVSGAAVTIAAFRGMSAPSSQFGIGSVSYHRKSGSRDSDTSPWARCPVNGADDLRLALDLGAGRNTRTFWRAHKKEALSINAQGVGSDG